MNMKTHELLLIRIEALERVIAPFAKLGGPIGFQASAPDTTVALMTLAGVVTVGDFRRAAEALRHSTVTSTSE
jgi:hypothetical protein